MHNATITYEQKENAEIQHSIRICNEIQARDQKEHEIRIELCEQFSSAMDENG